MSNTAAFPEPETDLSPEKVSKIGLGQLVAFCIPLATLAYVWTGPHVWYVAPLFIAPMAIFQWIDTRPHVERRQPLDSMPPWPFELLVYALTALHFFILWLLCEMFREQAVFSLDMVMVFVLVGGNSGFSIITAHELIHRRNQTQQLLGRAVLCSVMYEHFYTEHLRGHHSRVGTPEDGATARFGETYRAFWRRTVPTQFKSAWRLEARRLGDENMRLIDPRMLGNRVLHGLVVEWGVAFAVLAWFGHVAFIAYLLQAFVAVRALEAVNYFEHWGLRRTGRRVRPQDSWDTHSWFTYHGLIGLSRHADHHAHPTRPYQQLRVWDDAPLLPIGYVGLVDMVIARNAEFRELATQELERRKLGPFADDAPDFPEPEPERGLFTWLETQVRKLPAAARAPAVIAALLVIASTGVAYEAGPALGFGRALLYSGSVAAVFAAVFASQRLVDLRVQNVWISWGAAFAALPVLGLLVSPLIS